MSPLLERALLWIRRALGPLLAVSAVYLIAIAQLSPHPLPGLRALAGSVFFAGLTAPFVGSRFRRVELVLSIIALACALLALVAIAAASSGRR